jgi:putative colanic acid biosynthesis UDP-glucose lipid carrier transferase
LALGGSFSVSSSVEVSVPVIVGSDGPGGLFFQAEVLGHSRTKRLCDLVLGSVLALALLPVLLIVAVAIVVDSPGPILFRQERYGRGRRIFRIYKFRTMRVMESSGLFKQAEANDWRFTRLGKLLRRTSIDELPQLVNVLRGEMSLVGPRPHAVTMDDHFCDALPDYSDRHLVRPGMTGLAQVYGYRGPTATTEAIRERLRFDRAYIQNWSIWLDLRILVKTPFALMHRNAI